MNRALLVALGATFFGAAVVAAGACGGTTANPPVDASTMDALDAMAAEAAPGFDASLDATTDVATDVADGSCPSAPFGCGFDAGCPAALPAAGSACDTSPEFGCRVPAPGTDACTAEVTCQDGGWVWLDVPEAGTSCAYVPPAGCPATFAAAAAQFGQSCGASLSCWFAQGTCGCPIFDVEAGAGAWACITPAADSGCPVDVPNEGTPCAAPQTCPYGQLCGPLGGPVMFCNCCGLWAAEPPPPCPPPGP